MLGCLIEVLDTPKYHFACVCCAQHALKYMVMCNSNFDHNYLKARYFNMPTIIFILISNTNYKFYISFCSSFSALLNKLEIFLLGSAIHILCTYVCTILVAILIGCFSIISH